MKFYKELIHQSKESLSDKEYLNQFIDDMHIFKNSQECGVKDINSIHLGMTNTSAKTHGFKNPNMVIGTTDYQSPCKVAEYAGSLITQDQNVIQTRSIKHILDIHEFADGRRSLYTAKYPIINPNTNNVLGTFWLATDFKIGSHLKSMLVIHQERFSKHASMEIAKQTAPFELSMLERDVLFCFCLGISNKKDIADFLSKVYKRQINHDTTINDAIRRLYRKLNCNTPYQLIEFAVFNGLHLQIPESFLPTGSYALE